MGFFAHYTNMRSALQRVVSVTAVPLLLIAAVSSPGTRSSHSASKVTRLCRVTMSNGLRFRCNSSLYVDLSRVVLAA